MEYEVVNNPNYQPRQEQYTPDGQPYTPDGQPQGGQQGGFQPPPQQNGGGQQYQQPPQQAPQQYQQPPQQQYQQPPQQQNYQQPPQQKQGGYQNGGGQQRQVMKRVSQSGQPVQCSNLVTLQGYMNNMNLRTLQSGTSRLGFTVVVETPVYQGGQPQINPQTGQPVFKDFSYRCQAWGDVADNLARWPEGTPVKIIGSLNKWSMQDSNTGQTIWYTDVKVSRFDVM